MWKRDILLCSAQRQQKYTWLLSLYWQFTFKGHGFQILGLERLKIEVIFMVKLDVILCSQEHFLKNKICFDWELAAIQETNGRSFHSGGVAAMLRGGAMWWQALLLPIWILSYRHRGFNYACLDIVLFFQSFPCIPLLMSVHQGLLSSKAWGNMMVMVVIAFLRGNGSAETIENYGILM